MNKEKYLGRGDQVVRRRIGGCTHRKEVWVVGRAHPRLISSVVVTFVQVMHNDTSWPASKLRMNLFVQILANRAQKVLKKTDGESNRTLGLETASAFRD